MPVLEDHHRYLFRESGAVHRLAGFMRKAVLAIKALRYHDHCRGPLSFSFPCRSNAVIGGDLRGSLGGGFGVTLHHRSRSAEEKSESLRSRLPARLGHWDWLEANAVVTGISFSVVMKIF
ncbi:MAG: hypothetical protein ACHRXM_06695 [Isosphaerales bacterium]